MNIENHKQAKPRHKGKDVKLNYDLKRERERAAVESAGLRAAPAAAPLPAAAAAKAPARPRAAAKRPRKMAAE